MQTAPTAQTPGTYRKKIGDIVVTAITDGVLHGNFGLVNGIEEAEGKAYLASRFRSQEPIFTINCFVLHTGGYAAEDGRAAFPNAELLLHADEAKFWLETENPPDEMKPFFDSARAAIKPYASRMRTFTKGEVAPGVAAEPLPGHTPGHTGFHIGSGKDELVMWTDIVHLPALQARNPDVGVAFDADPEQARAQRKRMFDKVATDKLLVIGSHLDFPTFSHLEKASGGGYAFVPEVWRPYI